MNKAQIVLASRSPRRAELLAQLNIRFISLPVDIDESIKSCESPQEAVKRLALQKAEAGFAISDECLPVLGSDTIVVIDDKILGKPENFDDARQMLSMLSGNTHDVMTAVAVVSEHYRECCVVKTQVTFKPLTDEEIEWYWQTGEPADKAGSYGIQGMAGQFVTRINGSYSAVVGLPLFETSEMLKQVGIKLYER